MSQIRIVLDPKYKPKAEQILEQTGISTLSQLFTLLLVNYGDNLVNALKSQPMAVQSPNAQLPVAAAIHQELPRIQPKQATQQERFTALAL